jgi:hypothetical protein
MKALFVRFVRLKWIAQSAICNLQLR